MKPTPEIQTKVITNFSGRLTRIVNGDLDSGFAKFATSFGYDPFSKPMNLTWLETPTSIVGIPAAMPEAAAVINSSNTRGPEVFILDHLGNLYDVRSATNTNSNLNSIIGIASVKTTNFLKGASIEFFGSIAGGSFDGDLQPKLYCGGDEKVVRVNADGSAEETVGTAGNYLAWTHPLKKFAGSLYFGNRNTIGQIDGTGTVVSSVLNTGLGNTYSTLNPALGASMKISALDVSPSEDYLLAAASDVSDLENVGSNITDYWQTGNPTESKIFYWNGSDQTITAKTTTPSFAISALKTYLKNMAFFATDTFGSALVLNNSKILTLPNNKTPARNAVALNGNFLTWANPEIDSTNRYLSLYYFGSLDQENPPGLYRVLRWTTAQASGFVDRVGLNVLVSNFYKTINSPATSTFVTFGYGKHYLGLYSQAGSTRQYYLLSFLITSTGTGTPQLGVYETQTQLFSKRIGISQIRVYIEPSVAGNAFTLDMIGSDGTIIPSGTYTYTHGDLTDPLSGSTAVERINFNVNARTQYALGIRLTNTGTTNMTFKKIEVDYTEEGK